MVNRHILCVVVGILALAGCTQPTKRLVVGSKLSVESALLGEILAQHMQNQLGVPVDRRTGLQGSAVAHQALLSGEIDLYIEDTGSAYYSIFRLPVNKDKDILNARVVQEYQGMKMRWLAPLGLTAGYTAAALKDEVSSSSLSELAGVGKPVLLTVSLEFQDRLDGMPALLSAYPLKIAGSVNMVDANQVAEQLIRKIAHVAVVSIFDPIIQDPGVKVLQDDKQALNGYPAAIIVREVLLANNSLLESKLKLLDGKISNEAIGKLLVDVKAKRKTTAAAAAAFLLQAGLK